MISVLIAEDHTMVRYGTNMVLKELFPAVKISQAVNFEQVIRLVDTQTFDLLILDINIPGGDNFQMIDVIRLRQPEIKILIFSAYDEQLFAIRYLQAGAKGYLMKQAPESEMKEAIRTVVKNDIYISPEIKHRLLFHAVEKKQTVDSNPLHSLSDRETEVMQQLIKGATMAAIARSLGLQLSTVSTYKTRIFEKLEVNNLVELVNKIHLYHNAPAKPMAS
ncbi:MAG TPA: response regulator transcription factor [Chitinophagaceae bacterium]|jgi:DNA-binding NarL/FixJ family response regulator|nr:response regulator transcription factor [Chitinophagaceae bacterium]